MHNKEPPFGGSFFLFSEHCISNLIIITSRRIIIGRISLAQNTGIQFEIERSISTVYMRTTAKSIWDVEHPEYDGDLARNNITQDSHFAFTHYIGRIIAIHTVIGYRIYVSNFHLVCVVCVDKQNVRITANRNLSRQII